MDNFLDKVAQKFNAQDVIKANSQAEAAELKRLQTQVAEYEKILQEMRKLNFKNVELTDKLNAILDHNAGKFEDLQNSQQINLNTLQDLAEEQKRTYEELQRDREEEVKRIELAKEEESENARLDQEVLEGLFRRSDEFTHKENVKVYRNVQAVVIEELKSQTQALFDENTKIMNKLNVSMIIQIITTIILLGSVALNVIQFLK